MLLAITKTTKETHYSHQPILWKLPTTASSLATSVTNYCKKHTRNVICLTKQLTRDVYKRQRHGQRNPRMKMIVAVSYTHLDVYKRQVHE